MGMLDGRNLEKRSIPVRGPDCKTEVDLAYLSELNQEIADRIADVNAEEARALLAEANILNQLNAHKNTGISSAHPGQINTEAQIPNGSIGFHKINPTPATQNDFAGHVNDSSIHFTLGTAYNQAARGDHTHPIGEAYYAN